MRTKHNQVRVPFLCCFQYLFCRRITVDRHFNSYREACPRKNFLCLRDGCICGVQSGLMQLLDLRALKVRIFAEPQSKLRNGDNFDIRIPRPSLAGDCFHGCLCKLRSVGCHKNSFPVIIGRGLLPRRSEEHTSELQSRLHLVCRLLLEKKKKRLAVDTCTFSPPTAAVTTHIQARSYTPP